MPEGRPHAEGTVKDKTYGDEHGNDENISQQPVPEERCWGIFFLIHFSYTSDGSTDTKGLSVSLLLKNKSVIPKKMEAGIDNRGVIKDTTVRLDFSDRRRHTNRRSVRPVR